MANPLAVMETSQEFGSGATQGVVANSNPSSGMGYYVWLYGNYQPNGHAGKDLKAKIGTPIFAIDDGTVLYAGWAEDLPGAGPVRKWLFYYNFGGILTVIQHSWGISAIAHQSSNDEVYVGQRVKAGQLIGKSGNTKTKTTTVEPHVHIEALVYMDYRTDVTNGIIYGRVDPTPYFGSISAQSSEIEEDELSAAEADRVITEVKDYVHALLLGGYTSGGEDRPGIADQIKEIHTPVTRYLNAPTGSIPEKVVKAVFDEPVVRAGVGGKTTLRSTIAYLDKNINGILAAIKGVLDTITGKVK